MAREAELRNRRIKTNPTKVAYTGTANRNGSALTPGLYVITSDQDCYFLQGDSSVTATADSNPLWAKERAEIEVRYEDSDAYISAIQSSTGGTLWITRLEP